MQLSEEVKSLLLRLGETPGYFTGRIIKGQWSFIGPGSEKKLNSISADSPQGEWDTMAEKMMLEFAESGHPIFRAASPFVQRSAQKQRSWKIVETPLCRFGND